MLEKLKARVDYYAQLIEKVTADISHLKFYQGAKAEAEALIIEIEKDMAEKTPSEKLPSENQGDIEVQ